MELRVVAPGLEPYVPRLAAEWDLDAPNALWRELEATCCFVDISGFTALSERLARRGRIGAEELTEVLNHVFSRMLGVAYDKGGALLKFGGDALLLAFTREDHPVLGAQAAVAMRAVVREARALSTSVGRVDLKVSIGMHTGTFQFFRVGRSHRELLVTGPAATVTTRMEQIAVAGEIVVSEATAARLPGAAVGEAKGEGRLLRWRQVVGGGPGPAPPRHVPHGAVEHSIPKALRTCLSEGGESEHRSATVAFVKFQGVDELLQSQGPGAAAVALASVVEAVQGAADYEAVTFLSSDIDADGGKIILVAGVPAAQDDGEGRILRAARRVVEHSLSLPVRVGVNRGHVFAGDIGTDFRRTFTVMGDTVNLAARVMAAASAGSVLATAGVLEHALVGFDTEALEPFMVKGKSEPVQAYRVGPSTGPKSATQGSLPFRGRDEELALLVDAFAEAQKGRGSVVVIEAERGAGKSRLVTELLESLPPETDVLILQGQPHGAGIPYLPLQEPLRNLLGIDADDRRSVGHRLLALVRQLEPALVPLVPLLAPVVDAEVPETPESEAVAAEFVRQRVAGLVAEVLALARPGPLLIVAEDAHWFDDTTSGICARLADTAPRLAWLVCATRRATPGGFDPADAERKVTLAPLLDDTARDLVESATEGAPLRPHERDGVIARAGGNPLFLEELLRVVRETGVEALPDTLDSVAMRQIDSLPSTPRRVLRLASVLGRSFELELLTQMLAEERIETDADPCSGLETELVPDGPGRMRFRHAVLQEAAYQSLPFRTRLGLHLRVGETIERGSDEIREVAPLLSFHFLAAQDWKRSWEYSRLAAEVAQAAHAPGEAASHLERALAASRRLDNVAEDELASVLCDLGWTLELLGQYERSDDAYSRAAGISRLDPLPRARVADRRAWIRSEYLGRPSAAIRQVHKGLAELEDLGSGRPDVDTMRAQLLAREADVRMRQGRLSQAIACTERAIHDAEAVENKRALALALYVLDVCLAQLGRSDEAVHMDRAVELFRELDDHVHIAVALNNLAGVAFLASRWDLAADYVAQAAEESVMAGDLAGAAIAKFNLGEIRVNQGRLEEAERLLSEARRTLESFRYRVMEAMAAMQLGRARAFLGELATGIGLLRGAVSTFDEIGSHLESVEARARLAEVLVFGECFDEAHETLAEARNLEQSLGETAFSALIERVELTLCAALGDVSTVVAQLDPFLERARRLGADYDVLVALVLAERLVERDAGEDTAQMAEDLGVVKLAMLPV